MSGTLAIDTASDTVAVAYEEGSATPAIVTETRPREHSTSLLRLIDEVCGPRISVVSAIVVVRGPGAYAGIRVGIATAEGLSLAMGVPVSGVDTLRAVAEAARLAGVSGDLTAVHPAGRGDFAVQDFHADGSPGDPRLARLPLAEGQPIAGEGAGVFGGLEIDAVQRVTGALAAHRKGLASSAEALYVREPHITLAGTDRGSRPEIPNRDT